MENIKSHYDSVSAAWQIIMGDNQHYGFYINGQENLNQASENLIDAMLIGKSIDAQSKILDVGCGTGGPAFYLHKKFHAQITGIALGAKEIAKAKKNSALNKSTDSIHFLQADGQDNKLPNYFFDYVLMMESALLVPNKEKLFSENYRVLKPGGSFILCDQTKKQTLSPAQMYRFGQKLEALQATFGLTKTESLESYALLMQHAGFINIECEDITEQVKQSPSAWKQSCLNQTEKVLKYISKEQLEQFVIACETLEEFIDKNILSYGIVKGDKRSD